jgi:hypothetical protein
MDNGGIASLLLTSTLMLYPWGKNFPCPIDRKLGGSRAALDVVAKRNISWL